MIAYSLYLVLRLSTLAAYCFIANEHQTNPSSKPAKSVVGKLSYKAKLVLFFEASSGKEKKNIRENVAGIQSSQFSKHFSCLSLFCFYSEIV